MVIEAAGDPDSFVLCTRVVRPGGHIANIGMHGKPATLHLEALWRKTVTISTGQVDTSSTPWLLDLVTSGRPDVSQLGRDGFPPRRRCVSRAVRPRRGLRSGAEPHG